MAETKDNDNKRDGDKRRNRGGRPKKEAAEKLKYKVAIFLATKDYYALKAKAKAAKLRIGEVARRAVTGCRITPHFTPEQAAGIRNLAGMGNNLNQLTKLAHQAGYAANASETMRVVGEISKTLKVIRDDGEDN
jgi:hypothetical protein